MKQIYTKNAPEAIGPYSQALIANNMLFTSGQIPLMPNGILVNGGIAEQTEQVMQNINAVLQEAACSFNSVIKTTIYLKDMEDFNEVNEIYSKYFTDHKPARSCVEVSRLPKDVLIEIDLIALIS